jgi:hypothetical protein
MIIAHAYMLPGNYTVTEQSAALAPGQNPNNMADLIGAFVFGSKSAMILTNLNPSSAAAGGPGFTLTGKRLRLCPRRDYTVEKFLAFDFLRQFHAIDCIRPRCLH